MTLSDGKIFYEITILIVGSYEKPSNTSRPEAGNRCTDRTVCRWRVRRGERRGALGHLTLGRQVRSLSGPCPVGVSGWSSQRVPSLLNLRRCQSQKVCVSCFQPAVSPHLHRARVTAVHLHSVLTESQAHRQPGATQAAAPRVPVSQPGRLRLGVTGVAREASALQSGMVTHREVCTEKSLLKACYPPGEKKQVRDNSQRKRMLTIPIAWKP